MLTSLMRFAHATSLMCSFMAKLSFSFHAHLGTLRVAISGPLAILILQSIPPQCIMMQAALIFHLSTYGLE